jgi:signal transduction histidine kinase
VIVATLPHRGSLPLSWPASLDWRLPPAVGLALSGLLAAVDQSTVATWLAIASAIGGGVLYGLTRVEKWRQQNKLDWDRVNKESISAQLAESLSNQEKMRASLHVLRNDAQAAQAEARELRGELRQANTLIVEQTDRIMSLTNQIGELRRAVPRQADRLEAAIKEAASVSQSALPVVPPPPPAAPTPPPPTPPPGA